VDVDLAKLGILRTDNIDTILSKLDIPETYSIDVLYEALGLTRPEAIDVLFNQLSITRYDSVDVLFKKIGVTKTDNVDVMFSKLATTRPELLDLIIEALDIKHSYDVDVAFSRLNITKTNPIDVLFQLISTYSFDVVILQLPEIEMIGNQWWIRFDPTAIQYKDRPTLKEDTEYDPELHSAQPPFVIKDSGPTELNNTLTLPKNGFNVIGNNALDMYEICPKCEEVLHLYSIKDIITHDKIYRCRNCHQELVKSARGWIIPQDQESVPRKYPSDIGFA
jgi:hypothetical protein